MRASILTLFAGAALAAAVNFDNLDWQDLVSRGLAGEERDLDTSGEWFDLETGIMMEKRPSDSESLATVIKRDGLTPAQADGLQTRDGERMEVILERDADGAPQLPRSLDEAKALAKRTAGQQSHMSGRGMSKLTKRFTTIITWYTGHDLLYPACESHSNWNPTDNSLIAAMTIGGHFGVGCGDFVKLTGPHGKWVTVRVVDKCAACRGTWLDLTTRAFKTLYPQSVGKTHVKGQKVSKPFKKWTSAEVKLYGPQKL